MDLLFPIILTALLCLAVGFALGFLAGAWRAGNGDRPVETGPQAQVTPAAPTTSSPPVLTQPAGILPVTAPPAARPSLNPVDALARALQPEPARPAAPKSIAAQVDEILQEKLPKELPGETRTIRLVELPGRGVAVRIGLEQYEGVDAVPDPDIRGLIREAVKEWERRPQPG